MTMKIGGENPLPNPSILLSMFFPSVLKQCNIGFYFLLNQKTNQPNQQVGPQTPMEHIQAFKAAITWSEPFIITVIGFQIIMFLICLWVSRPGRGLGPRLGVMITIALVVRAAEWINGWSAEHWQSFATQNYFDRRGIFIGIMLCFPLLVDCFVMLLFFLREASQLLVQVKTQELKKKKQQQQQQQQQKGSETKSSATATRKKTDKKQD